MQTSLSSIRATSAAQSRAALLLTPPPTSTTLGTVPGAARYDSPPPGAEVEELKRSQRTRNKTERGAIWRDELCPQSRKPRPSSSVNAIMRPSLAPAPGASQTAPSTPQAQSSSSNASSASSSSKKKSKATHPLSATTIGGHNRAELIATLSRVLGQDCSSYETQELEDILETVQNGQATQVATQEQQAQAHTVVHPPEALNVGGGFHLTAFSDHPELPVLALGAQSNPRKRGRSSQSNGTSDTEDENDTTINLFNSQTHGIAASPPTQSRSTSAPRSSHGLPTASRTSQTSSRSSSYRPIGLPRSSINASAATRPSSLPFSSAHASSEVEVEVVPLSVSPSPSPQTALPAPRALSSTLVPHIGLLSTAPETPNINNIGSLLNYCLGLASKQISGTSAATHTTTQQQQALGAIESLQKQLQGALANTSPLSMTEPTMLSPFAPYPGMATPTYVPPPPDVVEDNEETLMALAAAASGKRTTSKPTLRDYTGIMRQNLTGGMVDFLAYILAEGPYETKRTMLIWALEACRRENERGATGPFETPPLEALKLVIARAPTLRCGGKDRARQLVPQEYGLYNPPMNQAQRQHNKQTVQMLLPNSFHAKDINLPRVDQYEHNIVRRSIALIGFHSPDAIGSTFHEYFNPMPLPTVAFALTTVQFCIEEWETGTFKAKDLRAERQYNTYCAHLKGLQQYESVANARMARFRREWFEFAIQYAGITIPVQTTAQEATQAEDVRPDTPPPSPDL